MRPVLFLLACAAWLTAGDRLSLVVGNNVGLPGETRLRYATEDARRIHEVLSELGGVAPGRGYLLLNRGPEELERALVELRGRVKEIKLAGRPVEILVFYSGHSSGEDLHMGGKSWPLENLRKFLADVDADLKITILDACHSGAFITTKGGIVSAPIRFREENDLQARGSVVLASSSALEYSHESSALRGSLFSHYLLSGLRGGADYNHDQAVSLWEAYYYARLHTSRQLAGGDSVKQNPRFDFKVAGEKDPVLTVLPRDHSRIRFQGCPPGTYTLYNQDMSEQWAEVELRAGDTVDLLLPRMDYVIHRVEDNVLHVASADLRYQPDWTLRPNSFRRTWIPEYRAKGGASLRLPVSLEVRLRKLKQVPEQDADLVVPEAGVYLHAGRHRWGAHLGWVNSETVDRRILSRRGLAAGGSWGLERYALTWLTWGPEVRYTAFLWKEESVANPDVFRERPVGPGEEGFALAQSLGADLRLRWRPWSRFYVDVSGGAETFVFGEKPDDVGVRLEWPIAVGVGFALR